MNDLVIYNNKEHIMLSEVQLRKLRKQCGSQPKSKRRECRDKLTQHSTLSNRSNGIGYKAN